MKKRNLIAYLTTATLLISSCAIGVSKNKNRVPSGIPAGSELMVECDSVAFYRTMVRAAKDDCMASIYDLWQYNPKTNTAEKLYTTMDADKYDFSTLEKYMDAGLVMPLDSLPVCGEVEIMDVYDDDKIIVGGTVNCRFNLSFLIDLNNKKAAFLGYGYVAGLSDESRFIELNTSEYVGIPDLGGKYDVYCFYNTEGKLVGKYDLFEAAMKSRVNSPNDIMGSVFDDFGFKTEMDVEKAEKDESTPHQVSYHFEFTFNEFDKSDLSMLDDLTKKREKDDPQWIRVKLNELKPGMSMWKCHRDDNDYIILIDENNKRCVVDIIQRYPPLDGEAES